MNVYQRRAVYQLREWVDGRPFHQKENDECCPDFSCCYPHMFEPSRLKRVVRYNEYAASVGLPPLPLPKE